MNEDFTAAWQHAYDASPSADLRLTWTSAADATSLTSYSLNPCPSNLQRAPDGFPDYLATTSTIKSDVTAVRVHGVAIAFESMEQATTALELLHEGRAEESYTSIKLPTPDGPSRARAVTLDHAEDDAAVVVAADTQVYVRSGTYAVADGTPVADYQVGYYAKGNVIFIVDGWIDLSKPVSHHQLGLAMTSVVAQAERGIEPVG